MRDYNECSEASYLTIDEFIRRFMLHILPSGLHKIRHYGLLAPKGKSALITICKKGGGQCFNCAWAWRRSLTSFTIHSHQGTSRHSGFVTSSGTTIHTLTTQPGRISNSSTISIGSNQQTPHLF